MLNSKHSALKPKEEFYLCDLEGFKTLTERGNFFLERSLVKYKLYIELLLLFDSVVGIHIHGSCSVCLPQSVVERDTCRKMLRRKRSAMCYYLEYVFWKYSRKDIVQMWRQRKKESCHPKTVGKNWRGSCLLSVMLLPCCSGASRRVFILFQYPEVMFRF